MDYTDLTIEEIKLELKERKIKFFRGAKKADLISLLVKDDESEENTDTIVMTQEELDNLKAALIEQAKAESREEMKEKLKDYQNEVEGKLKTNRNSTALVSAARAHKINEAKKLIRCTVSFNDPHRQDWRGELIRVGNSIVEPMAVYVPNNPDKIVHLPNIVVKYLTHKTTQSSIFRKKIDSGGKTVDEVKRIKKYTVTILPQLTQAELSEIAAEQQSVTE